MIKLILSGGLGNQMFQYAFAYSKLKDSNYKNEHIKAIMHKNKSEDKRSYSLDVFDLSLKLDVVNEKEKGFNHIIYRIKRKIPLVTMQLLRFSPKRISKCMSKMGFNLLPTIYDYCEDFDVKENAYIEGTFQNWRYFDNIREDIIKEFTLKNKINDECAQIINKMENTNSVCVHIRRGDYLNSYYSKDLAVCDEDYYKKAIKLIESKICNPEFFVFTNSHEDHEWIKQNYKFNGNVNYVDMDNPDYLELNLMTNCKHFIIANSTFSWWAQYLSKNDKKIVVAPSSWYRGNDSSKQIYMPNWEIVNVK